MNDIAARRDELREMFTRVLLDHGFYAGHVMLSRVLAERTLLALGAAPVNIDPRVRVVRQENNSNIDSQREDAAVLALRIGLHGIALLEEARALVGDNWDQLLGANALRERWTRLISDTRVPNAKPLTHT